MTSPLTPTAATDGKSVATMHAGPAVSVVVPCYNGGRYIDQLIESLERQTFRDFETIIVNDGSTDEATRAKLASLDRTIRVVHQENRGMSGARNAGIAAARGEFVLLLDCDDTIEPDYLAETVSVLRDARPDVAATFTHTRLAGVASGISSRYFNSFALLFSNTMPSCLLVRKQSCDAIGGYDEGMREGFEDWEFYLRLSRAEYRAIEIPKPLYIYNSRPDGMMLSKSAHLHGKLWRYIRTKHADAYRLSSILRSWLATRAEKRNIPLAVALALYAAAVSLPDSWFTRLANEMRRWRSSRRRLVGPASDLDPSLQCVSARRSV